MSGWLRWALVRVITVLAGVAAGLTVAEVALRLIGIDYSHHIVTDYYTGWALRPGASGVWTGEGHAHISINSQGRRDREHEFAKPPNTLRVAVLGDSYAAAFQVEVEDTFWSVTERALGSCPALRGRRVEALNFGVPGYGTVQELATLRRHVWRYSPDIVVLAFYPGNDVSDNMRAATGPIRPYANLQDGKLVIDNSFRESPRFKYWDSSLGRFRSWLSDHSRVEQVINHLKYVTPWRHSSAAGTTGPNWLEVASRLVAGSMNPPADETWREGWQMTDRLVETVNDEVKAHGATFLLVVLSEPVQVYPDPVVRARLQQRAGIVDPFYANRRLDNLAGAGGFAVLDLGEPFRAYAEGHHAFLHGFRNTAMGYGHWNQLGHRLAGKMIAAKLCAMMGEHAEALRPVARPGAR